MRIGRHGCRPARRLQQRQLRDRERTCWLRSAKPSTRQGVGMIGSPRFRRLVAIGVVVVLAAACGDDDGSGTPTEATEGVNGVTAPDPMSLPEAVAPRRLGEVGLPDQPDDITALFDRLPSELIGRQRMDESPGTELEINASYGNTEPVGCGTVGLQAMNVSTGEFFPPDWTAETFIAFFTAGADWNVEAFGRDGELFWVVWDTTCSDAGRAGEDSIYTASWGQAGSPWVFGASAGDPEGRDELTAAFVTASR